METTPFPNVAPSNKDQLIMEGPVTEPSDQFSFAEKAAPYYTFLWGTALLHSAHPHENEAIKVHQSESGKLQHSQLTDHKPPPLQNNVPSPPRICKWAAAKWTFRTSSCDLLLGEQVIWLNGGDLSMQLLKVSDNCIEEMALETVLKVK